MFRRLVIAILVSAQMAGSAAAYSVQDGQYYFRYKVGTDGGQSETEPQTKAITAFYIGGVGKAFSEKLPMKPEWEDDNWRVTKGTLPAGLSFDPATLTFTGTPQSVVSNVVVELNGFDTSGQQVASAVAHFDTYELPDQVVDVDIYNHTGKYGSYALNLPSGVTIEGDPKLVSPVPPGVAFNARYFDGTPTKAGTYPVLALGYNYLGKAVIAFTGRYTVDDAPVFATIPPDLQPLQHWDYYGCGRDKECAPWDKKGVPRVKRAIKDASKVRYQVEIKDNAPLPGSLSYYDGPYQLKLSGLVFSAYEQATVRYKATDTDGTVGYSNWFKIGSLGLSGICQPYGSVPFIGLKGSVGSSFNGSGYQIPTGLDTSVKTFTISDGALPSGLKLDSSTGLISGTPIKEEYPKGLKVRIDYPDTPGAAPTLCGPYDFNIVPATTSLSAIGLKADYRVGEAVNIELKPIGAMIGPWSVTLNDGAVLPAGVHFDKATRRLIGSMSEAGHFLADFTYHNGDGNIYYRAISFAGHDAVHIDDLQANYQIKQYDTSPALVNGSYDATTAIAPGSERFSLIGGPLPDGLAFNPYSLVIFGGTRLPENKYGPYRLKMVDATGQSDETNDFYIEVTKRDGLTAGATINPMVFGVNTVSSGQLAFPVIQPPLAIGYLPLSYKLAPSTLPAGLSFDPLTGMISGLPTVKSETAGYQLTATEAGPDALSITSDPFTILVNEPPPIQDQTLAKLEGNVGGPVVTSVSPIPTLIAIRNQLVGFETAAVFDTATPSIGGLSFDPATGTISGTPSSEYSGNVVLAYHDGGARPGILNVPVRIYPYPQLTSAKASYDLPRLSQAVDYDIKVTPANSGFYKGIDWQLAPGSDKLPVGLSLSGGAITGSTSVTPGTAANLIIRAVSKVNGIIVDRPLSLKIAAERPMTLDIAPNDKLVFMIDETTGSLAGTRGWFSNPAPSGSYVTPVTWSLKDQPDWMTIGTDGQIYGKPSGLGEWTVQVVATDKEGHKAQDTVVVKVTLSGYPIVSAASGSTSLNETIRVRNGETFRTQLKVVSNAVKPWEWTPQGKPVSLDLDATSGEFTGRIESDGTTTWNMGVKDADGRVSQTPVLYSVTTVPPVAVASALSSRNGKQYDPAEPVEIQFQPAVNAIGKLTYAIEGNLPGPLYYKVYDGDNAANLATYVHDDGTGGITTIRQPANLSADQAERDLLPPDHMIFDSLSLKLKGIPSSSGTFTVSMIASDDHEASGYKVNPSDPTRMSYNVAQTPPVTLTVEPAADLLIANSASSETLSQYISKPQLTTTVTNDAYGRGMTWRLVAGTLPNGLSLSRDGAILRYDGYASNQGSWANITWEGTDAAGRKIVSDPVSFTVGPRQALALVSSLKSPRPMIVFSQDADLYVKATNVADGKLIGTANWTVSGASKLPPGVSYDIADDGVHFHGTSDKIALYSGITVSAKDSRNATASIDLVFNVIANPAPIVLNVANIKTKPGFPIEMQPPFAIAALSTDNTYGDIRFYSNNLSNIQGVTLNQSTGFLSGTINNPTALTFDLFVTDDTNRVTSKPVTAEIIPYLRLIAPTVINVEQGTPASEPIATDYVIGKVTYAKGAGTWPAGLDVNLQTGAIVGTPTAAKGDYPGLKIVGTDTFGSFKDIQSSNSFTIHVNPTTAKPVISNIASNSMIFGTVGTFAEFTPTVVDNVAFKPWRYEGTVYKLNKALPQGLNFDTVTGRIYGTAQQATIIPDLTITVTSELGDSATTAPFSFEVKPQTTTLRLTIYGSTDVHACMGYIQLFMGGTDVFPQATLYLPPGSYGFGTDPDNLKDPSLVQGGHGKDGGLLCWNYSNGSWLDITVPVGMSSGQILLYQRNDEWGYGALFTDVSLSITNKDGSLSQLVRQAIPNAHPGQIVTLGF